MRNAGRLDSSVYSSESGSCRVPGTLLGYRRTPGQADTGAPSTAARAGEGGPGPGGQGRGAARVAGAQVPRGLGWSPLPGHRYLRGYPDGRRGRTRSAGAAAMAPRPGLGRLTCWRCPIWAEPASDINRRRGEGARAPAGRRRPGSSAGGRVLALRAHPPALGCRDYAPQRLRVCVHVYTCVQVCAHVCVQCVRRCRASVPEASCSAPVGTGGRDSSSCHKLIFWVLSDCSGLKDWEHCGLCPSHSAHPTERHTVARCANLSHFPTPPKAPRGHELCPVHLGGPVTCWLGPSRERMVREWSLNWVMEGQSW